MDKKYYCLESPYDYDVTTKDCKYQSECKDCEFYMTPKENLRKKFTEMVTYIINTDDKEVIESYTDTFMLGVEEYLEDLKSYEDKQV